MLAPITGQSAQLEMLQAASGSVQDFRHSAVTSFCSLLQHFIHCEVGARSLIVITLPKGATEATCRAQIVEKSASK